MRTLGILGTMFLASCATIPGFDEPRISTAPHIVLLEVDVETAMQSDSGGNIVNNPRMNQDDFGINKRSSEFGGTIRIGDGFSGLEFSYLNIDMTTTKVGNLTANWGVLRQGDLVNSEIKGDEFRLRYIAQFFDHSFPTDYEDVRLQVGAGPGLAHRELKLEATDAFHVRTQKAKPKDDGVAYLASRARVSYSGFGMVADYQISPDLNFGGDFEGTMWDLELYATYTFEDQDLTAYAGWRRSKMDSSGHEGAFDYDLDWTLEGYVLGVEFTF